MAFSGFEDLDPRFSTSLQDLIAASPYGITPFSGFRSNERQRQLWEASDKSGHLVARPGHSQHNYGRAVDLHYANAQARTWAHENAAQYGLTFPMSYEPWHIEPVGARGGPGPQVRTPQPPAMAQPQQWPQQAMQASLPNRYMQAIFGEGGDSNWLQNPSFSFDALVGDYFQGHSPLRRFIYQKLFM